MILTLLKILSRSLDLLPTRLLLSIGDIIGILWFHVVRFRRALVLENLRSALGPHVSEDRLCLIARENFKHYGRCFVEVLQSFAWETEDFRERVDLVGMEHLVPYRARGEGGFFLVSHTGNWEFGAPAGVSRGLDLDIVVKRPKSRLFARLFQSMREKRKYGVFPETGTAKDILRSLGSGRFVGFMLDQFMGPPIGLPVKFFGKEAGTAVALALFADKTDAPVFPGYSWRQPNGRVQVVIEPPIAVDLPEDRNARLYARTQAYNDAIERIVRKHPEQWLWLHRRWKAFRGEPRWILGATRVAVASLVIFLSACASMSTTSTGIILPPEPEVQVPDFSNAPQAAPEGEPASVKAPEPKKAKAKKVEALKESLPVKVFAMEDLPFEVGERLVIGFRWMMLPAGSATIRVDRGEAVGDRPTLRFYGHILSSKLVDTIYHVDNTVESLVDQKALVPYRFLLSMYETAQKKETRVKFDHVRNVAHYQSDRKSQKWGDQVIDRKDGIKAFVQDLFSGIYYARTLTYSLGKTQSFFLYENGQQFEVELTPVANELVTAPVGAFQCWKIKVGIKLDNVLKPTGDVFMWLSDDSKKYIVKFDAKIKIGSLNGGLEQIKER